MNTLVMVNEPGVARRTVDFTGAAIIKVASCAALMHFREYFAVSASAKPDRGGAPFRTQQTPTGGVVDAWSVVAFSLTP